MASLRHILLEVSAETGDAQRELRALAAEVEAFGRLSADARVGVTAAGLKAELARANAELAAFRRQHAEASLGLDTKAFKAKLTEAMAELAAFAASGPNLPTASPGLGTSPIKDAIAAERAARAPVATGGAGPPPPRVPEIAGQIEDDGRRAEQAARRSAQGVQEAWQGAALNIRALMTIGMTGLIAAIVAVAPQIVLLASSLAGAAAAAGGLATAFAASLGPALLAIAPLISGLSKLFAAFKATTQAGDIKRSIVGQQQISNAAIQQARAETALTRARRDAARGIRDALHADQQATQGVTNAQFELKQATRDAYRAWQDAINDVRDATLGLKSAQLDVQQAQLTKQQALLDLRNMRKELAATGTELDHFFGKVTEVQLDPARVQQLLPQVDRLGLTKQQAIDVKERILAVQKATLGVKEAEQNRNEVEIKLTRAIERRNEFEQRGLKAYRPLVAAQQNLADAQWASARASEHLADVQKEGVAHNPQVVAAQDSLRTAQQASARSADQLTDAWNKVPKSLRPLRRLLDDLRKSWVSLRDEVTAKWAPTIGVGIGLASGFLKVFHDQIVGLAATQSRVAGNLLRGLASPRALLFFQRMFNLADRLTRVLGEAFGHLLGFLSNIADAATHPLERAADAVNKTLGNWDRQTKLGETGGNRMKRIFEEGTTALGKWLNLLGSVGSLVINFFDATAGPANEVLDSITKTVNKWNDWVKSNPDKIQKFFEDVKPAASAVAKSLGDLFESLVAVLPTILRMIGTGFDLLSHWLDVIKGIFRFFDKFLSPTLAGVATIIVGWLGPIALVKKALAIAFAPAKGFAAGLFGGGGLEKRAGALGKRLGDAVRKGIGKLFRRGAEGAAGGAATGAAEGATAAGEMRTGIISGGAVSAIAMRRGIIEGGVQAAATIAAAMRGGAVPVPGTPGPGRPGPGAPTPTPTPVPGPRGEPPGRTPPGGVRGFLGRLGFLGRASVVAGSAFVVEEWTRGIVRGFKNHDFKGALTDVRHNLTGGLFPSQADIDRKAAEVEAQSEAAMRRGLALGRHSDAAIDINLSPHTDVSTKALHQLGVAFRNLSERATGGLGELRKAFRDNLDQITADIPAHTRGWSQAVAENTRRMMQAVARNVRQGRIPVAAGFDEIRKLMASRSLRGRDAVVGAFKSAAAGIRRWLSAGKISTATYTDQMDTITRTFLRRMHVRVSDFTRSYRKAFADLIQAGVDAQTALFALQRSKASGKAGGSERTANAPGRGTADLFPDKPGRGDQPPPGMQPDGDQIAYWRKRGYRWDQRLHIWKKMMRGGVVPGYGGGDAIPALLEAGEGILRKEVVRAIGPARIAELNRDPASLVRLNYGGTGMAPAVNISPPSGRAWGSAPNENHFHITTAPRPDLPPDPAIVAAQLTMRMRQRGLA